MQLKEEELFFCNFLVAELYQQKVWALKKAEKDGDISKDEHTKSSEVIQKLTDEFIKKIDDALVVKDKEILGQ